MPKRLQVLAPIPIHCFSCDYVVFQASGTFSEDNLFLCQKCLEKIETAQARGATATLGVKKGED